MNTLLKNYILPFILALSVVYVFQTFFFQPFKVEGSSMYPTLNDEDRIFINKNNYTTDNIKRGDIIVFNLNNRDRLVKRVIAKSGDTLELKAGIVYLNNEPLEELYISQVDISQENFNLVTVPEGYIFVMGDNRKYSSDSRIFGFVNSSTVIGRVDLVYWPFKKLK